MNPTTLELLKLAVEVIKAVAWPAVAVGLAVWFHKPLAQIVQSLPRKFNDASKVTWGGLTLEVDAKAREAGNPGLAARVGALSAKAIEHLLLTPRNGRRTLLSAGSYRDEPEFGIPRQEELDALAELEGRGFIKWTKPLKPFLTSIGQLPPAVDDRVASARDWRLSPYSVDSREHQDVMSMAHSLTAEGGQAVDAIVQAVAEQLAGTSSVSTVPRLPT